MRPIVYLGQMLEVKMGVDLRRGDIGMAEEFLDTAKIVARLEQMGRERVPEDVAAL